MKREDLREQPETLHSLCGSREVVVHWSLDDLGDHIQLVCNYAEPASVAPIAGPGEFFEGLWNYDCVELWLSNPENGRYLELNLSPNGAWWSCVFIAPRQRDTALSPPQLQTQGQVSETSWSAKLTLPWSEVHRCLGSTQSLKANFTLVLGGCGDPEVIPSNLFSLATLSQIDFHAPDEWLPFDQVTRRAQSDQAASE